jgi:hypothetical protein
MKLKPLFFNRNIAILSLSLLFISIFLSVIFYSASIGFSKFVTMSDIPAFYTAGKMIKEGDQKLLYSFSAQFAVQKKINPYLQNLTELAPFRNPPFVVLPFIFLSFFTLNQAYIVVLFFNLVLLSILLRKIFSVCPEKNYKVKVLMVLSLLTFSPVFITLIVSQLSFLLALAFLFAYEKEKQGKYVQAGLWLSLLLIKPQYLFVSVLLLIIHKRYKELSGLCIGAFLSFLISFVIVGWSGIRDFLSFSLTTLQFKEQYTFIPALMPTLRGALLLLFGDTNLSLITIFWLIGSFLLIFSLLRSWIGWHPQKISFQLQWGLLIISSLLISPYANIQDFSLLIIPAIFSFEFFRKVEDKMKLKAFLILFFSIHISSLFNDLVAISTHIQSMVVLVLIFYFFTLQRLSRLKK